DTSALFAPTRSRIGEKNLNGGPFLGRMQLAQRIGDFIQRINIQRTVCLQRKRMTFLQIENGNGRVASWSENGIIRHLFYHRVRKKAMNLLFYCFSKDFRNGKIEEYFLARRRIGDLKNYIRRIKKQFLQKVRLRLDRGERRKQLFHSQNFLFPSIRIRLLSFRRLFFRHLDHLKIHVERLVHLISKSEKTAQYQKCAAYQRNERKKRR